VAYKPRKLTSYPLQRQLKKGGLPRSGSKKVTLQKWPLLWQYPNSLKTQSIELEIPLYCTKPPTISIYAHYIGTCIYKDQYIMLKLVLIGLAAHYIGISIYKYHYIVLN